MSASSATPRRAPSLVGFFLAAAAVAALGFLPMVLASYRGAASVPGPVRALQLLMLFGPGLLAIAWSAREGGRGAVKALLRGVIRWRVHPAWYAAVLLGPAVLYLAALVAGRTLGLTDVRVPPAGGVLATFAASFAGYVVLNTEELAWRGYAWPRLRDRLGALRGSVLLGVIWGVLHAPLFLMKGGHPGGWPPLLFLAMTVAWSVLFALAYEGTGGSILIVHLLHQALNGWSDALPIYPRVAHSSAPAAIFVVLAAAIAVVAVRRAGWRWSGESGRAARAARAAGASARPGAPLPDRPI